MTITPFTEDEEKIDYEKLIKEFGTKPISTIKTLPDTNSFDKGLVFSHRDFDKYMNQIKKKVSILSGINASGPLHIGHFITFRFSLEMQKKYKMPVYLPISDDESYVTKKINNQEEGMKNAKLIASQLFAMGFDKKLTKIFIHQDYTKIYNFAIKLGRSYTLSTLKATYGFTDSTNSGLMFYPAIQAADVLFPQKHIGKHYTLVPIGIDQDPHIRLARDIAEKHGFIKPATVHMKYIPGLTGGKMSVSKGNGILLNEDPKKAAKMCMKALTGGRETLEEQKKKGGEPSKCVVFEYLNALFYSTKEVKNLEKKCKSGKIMCGECKKNLAKHMEKFLTDFQKKTNKELKDVDKNLFH